MATPKFKNYHANLSFLDLLFNMIVGFVFLFMISFVLINVQKEKTNIATKAEFVITLTWDTDSQDDVDLWIEDPEDNILSFKKKEIGLMHLDRDDLGGLNDTITTITGATISYPYNQEIATIRGFITGEWTINIHMYRKQTPDTTNIEVKVEKLNPIIQLVTHEKVQMYQTGEETTIIRFFMASDGTIPQHNKLFKSIVKRVLINQDQGGGL